MSQNNEDEDKISVEAIMARTTCAKCKKEGMAAVAFADKTEATIAFVRQGWQMPEGICPDCKEE